MIAPAAPPTTAPMIAPRVVDPVWLPITPPTTLPAVAPMMAPFVLAFMDAQPLRLAIARITRMGPRRAPNVLLFMVSSVDPSRRIRLFQRPLMGAADGRHQRPKRLDSRRLDEVVIESGVPGAMKILFLAPSCQGDERHVAKPWLLANPTRHFEAVHFRHSKIEKNERRKEALHDL